MPQPATANNPFMLMLDPQAVLAAVEKSERLGQLNRHLCRPLDRQVPPGGRPASSRDDEADLGPDLGD
jgi:hypothetical protein